MANSTESEVTFEVLEEAEFAGHVKEAELKKRKLKWERVTTFVVDERKC